MGIRSIYDEKARCRYLGDVGAWRAAIICDLCGGQIDRPQGGNVVFDESTHELVACLHKECDWVYWEKLGLRPTRRPWNDVGHCVAELNQALGNAVQWSHDFEIRLLDDSVEVNE